MHIGRRQRFPGPAWAALPVLGAYGWWATGLRPFTTPALGVTLVTGFVVLLAGVLVRRRLGPPATSGPPGDAASGGLAVWGALVVGLALWELAAFLQLPRSSHPTLSSLANSVFDSHLVRTLTFMAWMAAGFGMARR